MHKGERLHPCAVCGRKFRYKSCLTGECEEFSRQARSPSGRGKLSECDLEEIAMYLEEGDLNPSEIARRKGVSSQCIANIRDGKTHRNFFQKKSLTPATDL